MNDICKENDELKQEINKLTAESTEWESKCYDLQQENDKLKEIIKKIKDELFKNQFEFTYYGCWLNIKDILESEVK